MWEGNIIPSGQFGLTKNLTTFDYPSIHVVTGVVVPPGVAVGFVIIVNPSATA